MGVLSRALSDAEYQALDWFSHIEGTEWTRFRWNAARPLLELSRSLEQSQPAIAQAYQVLGGAISMQIDNAGTHPYGPMVQTTTGRSLSFEDLGSLDADFLGRVARDTEDPWLRARFADLAVSVGGTNGVDWRLGKLCVEAQLDYLRGVFLTENAIEGVDECRRALKLLWAYARRDEALWNAYWELIDQAVNHAAQNNWPGVVFPLCDEAMRRNQDACRSMVQVVQAKGETLATTDPLESARYFDYAARLWARLGNQPSSREAMRQQGEALVSAAAAMVATNPLAAPHWLIEGIRALRRAHAPASRVAELRELLSTYQLASLDAFRPHEFRLDVSGWIRRIDAEVVGPSFFEALLQTAFRIDRWPDFDRCRQQAIDSARQSVFSSLFASQLTNDQGEVVAAQAGFDANNEESVYQRMVAQLRQTELDLRGKVAVDYATGLLYSNYQPTFSSIKEIVDASPITAPGHSETLARGLYAGLSDDWIAAGAYLIPAVEPLVRAMLQRRGAHTATIRDDGTQLQRTLDELLAMPEAREMFGDGLLLELRTLLSDPLGFNLRHAYSHGLLPDEHLRNAGTMCLWWTLLRMILFPWADHPVVQAPLREIAPDPPSDAEPESAG